jgi:uncharacterized protein (DUF433 family)
MDWSECDLVERVPGKVGGRPVTKGTRIEPDFLLVEAELGRSPEQTHEEFPTLSVETIMVIQAYERVKLSRENVPSAAEAAVFSRSIWHG